MDPNGVGSVSKNVQEAEKQHEDEQRAKLGITTERQLQTGQVENEKSPDISTPIPKSPVSPDSPHSKSSAGSSSDDFTKIDTKIVQVRDAPKEDEIFAHLPKHEQDVLKRQVDTPAVPVKYTTLYRYATTWDKIFLVIAAICAIGGGAAMPLMTVVFGNLSGSFSDYFLGNLTQSFSSILNKYVLYFVYLAIGEFILI